MTPGARVSAALFLWAAAATAIYAASPQRAPLALFPDTRLSVQTRIDPNIKSALNSGSGVDQAHSNIVSDAVVAKLRRSGREWSIVTLEPLPNNGRNIIIHQRISLNKSGKPYRITVSARQGSRTWSDSIERPYLMDVPGNVPIRPGPRLPDGRPYWDLRLDSAELAKRLSAATQIAR